MAVTGKTRASRQAERANTQAAQVQQQAAQQQGAAAIQVAQIQSEANLQAAAMGLQGTQLQVQGGIDAANIVAGATGNAANLQFAANRENLEQQREIYDESVERLAPYAEIGAESLGYVQETSTLEGFEDALANIIDTNSFRELRDDNVSQASNAFAQAGLSRSGAHGESVRDINMSTALGLESQIYGRNMNNVAIGQSAAAGQNYAGTNFANQSSASNTAAAANAGNIIVNGAGQQAGYINQSAQAAGQGLINQGQYIQQGAYYQAQGIAGQANANSAGANAQAGALVANAQNAQQTAQNRANNVIAVGQTIAGFF